MERAATALVGLLTPLLDDADGDAADADVEGDVDGDVDVLTLIDGPFFLRSNTLSMAVLELAAT